MKPRFRLTLPIASGMALVLALAATGLSAAPEPKDSQLEKKAYICHLPPGNHDNPQRISISNSAVDTHKDHHGDWYTVPGGDCHEPPESLTALAEGFSVLACINRSGKRMGNRVDTHLTGRVANYRMGCEI